MSSPTAKPGPLITSEAIAALLEQLAPLRYDPVTLSRTTVTWAGITTAGAEPLRAEGTSPRSAVFQLISKILALPACAWPLCQTSDETTRHWRLDMRQYRWEQVDEAECALITEGYRELPRR